MIMKNSMLRPALVLFFVLTILTGLIYPLFITVIGQAVFSHQSGGSLIVRDKPVGSSLIGQNFSSPKYFWGRPSVTDPVPYNAAASSGSNLSPANPALANTVKKRIEALQAADPDNKALIPVDLVTASSSGLDPEISLAAAHYQAGRVARERNLTVKAINELIKKHAIYPSYGFLGEPRVNVLLLNLALDKNS